MPILLSACGGGEAEPVNATSVSKPEPNTIPKDTNPMTTWLMPDEGDKHLASWMSFNVSSEIWGTSMVSHVQDALAKIANTIILFEPVKVIVNQENLAAAKTKLDPRIELIPAPADDLWIRDSGCITVRNKASQRQAIDFNFNGWGNKQAHANDATIASSMAKHMNLTRLYSKLVLEGGALEVDGQGTAIITESCVINNNRNPGWHKADIEKELLTTLGIRKVIWLPGIAGKDITDGHTDFYARFVKPGVVLANLEPDSSHYDYAVTRQHLNLLKNAKDAFNRPLNIITLSPPRKVRPEFAGKDFAAGYINFYLVNGGLLCPEFGDADADEKAKITLMGLFPDRKVHMINIDALAAGGGGIHCATQQEVA
nr:agmatine deiminase family protein [uncultured Undibacterium sp.]